ncbi:triacylglycerol lipase [Streptomyces sp. A3M-1-3]|uniref:esterase/lipase family protein n=1 Tax=Streptomyces sp. A3M-1-3 TaxID=2962044 RepID=UPI0020B8059B|nr:triacylglycerol lipase [Streptomyces sp. A3M-1-3]MCP3822203.1 triacylglycerol lipase [Streptomyces sp. A3M-1-3]
MGTSRPALITALAVGCLGALSVHTPAAGAQAAATPDPIVFVHGWNSSGSTWDTMAGRFAADGWPAGHLDKWTYNTRQSNATTASQLSAEIDRVLAATGASKVDVVTHSMGGLSSRYYAKNLGGAAKIDAWISLGGPNHGTDTAYFCGDTSCSEMRPGSSFLNTLNSGDETPGASRYATWWSPCDSVINPDSSVALSGATNTKTACLSHGELRTDSTVYAQVKSFVG